MATVDVEDYGLSIIFGIFVAISIGGFKWFVYSILNTRKLRSNGEECKGLITEKETNNDDAQYLVTKFHVSHIDKTSNRIFYEITSEISVSKTVYNKYNVNDIVEIIYVSTNINTHELKESLDVEETNCDNICHIIANLIILSTICIFFIVPLIMSYDTCDNYLCSLFALLN
eukprot:497681_1